MKYLNKMTYNCKGVFEESCEEYMRDKKGGAYLISDLYKAFIEGCNVVTQQQHENAILYAEEFKATKSPDVVYTPHDVELAYRAGAKKIAEEWEKSRVTVTAKKVEKASKLICACSQLMSIADNFNKEAEKLMSHDLMDFVVKNKHLDLKAKFEEIKAEFREWNNACADIFLNLSINDNYRWGEENEKIERSVRKIMKID